MNNGLSPIKKAAISTLDYLKTIIIDDCSDDDVADAMIKFHPSSNRQYFNPDDYVNYDEACSILHLGNNRGKLHKLCKEHGIKNISIKNRPLGFKKDEIVKLIDKI